MDILNQLFSLPFWIDLFERFAALGPAAPVLLAALESILPPMPLIAIVTLNVAAHGPVLGFLYSWGGTCAGCTLVFLCMRWVLRPAAQRMARRSDKMDKARTWVKSIRPMALFGILMLPFTPSSFMNFAFGVSEYPAQAYLLTLYLSKLVMIGSLALFGQSAVQAMEDPRYIALSVALAAFLWRLSKWMSNRHHLS